MPSSRTLERWRGSSWGSSFDVLNMEDMSSRAISWDDFYIFWPRTNGASYLNFELPFLCNFPALPSLLLESFVQRVSRKLKQFFGNGVQRDDRHCFSPGFVGGGWTISARLVIWWSESRRFNRVSRQTRCSDLMSLFHPISSYFCFALRLWKIWLTMTSCNHIHLFAMQRARALPRIQVLSLELSSEFDGKLLSWRLRWDLTATVLLPLENHGESTAPVKVRHADGTHHSSSANMQGGTKGIQGAQNRLIIGAGTCQRHVNKTSRHGMHLVCLRVAPFLDCTYISYI